MSERRRFAYSPKWAPHVEAMIDEPEVDVETGMREEQRIDMRCGACGETMRRTCSSGAVRDHVNRFAAGHLHRDPLAPTQPKPV